MKIILLSGGSGKRLWPLSNNARAKQFLKLLPSKDGTNESMLERVWGQLKSVNLINSVYISSSSVQVDSIHNQIGQDVPIIIEPEQRDTFAAIALSVVYLSTVEKVNENDVVCILPVDPFVEISFFEKLKELSLIVGNESNGKIGLIGVSPTFPSMKYGYILSKELPQKNFRVVSHFVEKPNQSEAEKLIEQGAMWNTGIFAFKIKFLLQLLKEKGISTNYSELIKNYNQLTKNSFDYEVVENTNELAVISYDGKWKDLGTWNTLTEEMANHTIGKAIISEDSNNCHLINELNIPAIVLGLSNTIVTASPDGILISEKSKTPILKEIVKDLNTRPMYEEKRWGTYRVLDFQELKKDTKVLTKFIKVLSGKNLSYQMHQKRSEVWTIVSGIGEFALDGKIIEVRQGDVVKIPIGAKHGIKALTDLEFIEVQIGTDLIEEDITRLSIEWGDIKNISN